MGALADLVANQSRVLIRQNKEWGEILTGLEARNRFELCDESGRRMGLAAEEGRGFGGLMLRTMLGRCRRATIQVFGANGERVGRGEKPFRWFFHRMEIYDGDRRIGAIERRFSLLNRVFSIENDAGTATLTIESPLLRIWTFNVLLQGQQIGVIRKRWGGLGREMFTDADTFGLEVQEGVPAELRAVLLVATFLIDFTCFERTRRS
ncbi:MAG: phospholipid scramblase-related protein [Planctomycetota bacterium]